ncbi:MAG: hypothetical protein WCL07_02690 [bacterium]
MNKERILGELVQSNKSLTGVEIFSPGSLTPEATAGVLALLLKAMYVEHGVTKNIPKLVEDMKNDRVKTWLAKKDGDFVATASLVEQGDDAWELGRAVSLKQGIGKHLMLTAALDNLETISCQSLQSRPLVAEVRAAIPFMGIPGSDATQHICLDLLELVPHAIAPLFGHAGRQEPFLLASSDLKPGESISTKMQHAIGGRSIQGPIRRTKVVMQEPFHLIVPDDNGRPAGETLESLIGVPGCSMFAIEVTDANMPLVGMLAGSELMVLCGVDRKLGPDGKPILFIATLGGTMPLAPTHITDALPQNIQVDAQHIADQFTKANNLQESLASIKKWESNIKKPIIGASIWQG